MDARLRDLRSFYGRYLAAVAEPPVLRARLAAAFETVPRERFLPEGPWQVLSAAGYITTPSADVACLYQDIVVALCEDGPFNNGEPSLHARCLASAAPTEGETVVHVGAGTGYYTAILGTLVGPTGAVFAYEIEQRFAVHAAANLADFSNVTVRHESGSEERLPDADVIYVSAGATAPLDLWLDALRPGGRLIVPITPAEGIGAVFVFRRTPTDTFGASMVSPAMFVPCAGARDPHTANMLTEAFQRGGAEHVKSLHRATAADYTCWFAGDRWWLSTALVETANANTLPTAG